jgi:hypothetical protein
VIAIATAAARKRPRRGLCVTTSILRCLRG